ncbi:ATP synthase F1 subunit gamma [Candidatus Uhrbacteria bacterium]|nr:ATP synthase F1 subunit gamma [Candidatus Uhrbacteria bacterium]
MAISPRLIRRRIRSVSNTKKITKAMELVAAAKMRRAVAAALKTRAYAKLAWGMVDALQGTVGEEVHPLLRKSSVNGQVSNVLYVVMASDRGLCGGFNAALFREVVRDVQHSRFQIPDSRFVTIGRKAEQFIRRMGWNLAASFTNIAVAPTVAELRPIARLAMDAFTSGDVDEVRIAFTDFISSLRQQPRVKTLLPLQRIEEVGVKAVSQSGSRFQIPDSRFRAEFLFEPSPRAVLDQLLPRVVELQTYQCYLETGAAEHSARMLAMRSASDSAGEMIDDLTLTFNQARQSLITREIAEISAGSAALQS